TTGKYEYTVRANRIGFFPGKKGGSSHGYQNNTGNIYIVRAGNLGAGNRDDYGSIVATIRATDPPFFLELRAVDRDVFWACRYSLDADNTGDGAAVTLFIC